MRINMHSKFRILCLGFAVILALTGCSTIRKHPDFDKRAAEIHTVSLIAPEINIQRLVFKGNNEVLFDEGKKASQQVLEVVSTEFTKLGYDVKPLALSEETLKQNPDLETALSKLQVKYDSLVQDVEKQYVKKNRWKDFRISLGSDVNQFADLAAADAFVFVTGTGFVKSGGEIAKDVAKTTLIAAASLGSVIYITPSYGGVVYVSIVDANTGDILWHNFNRPNRAYNFTKPGDLKSMVKGVIRGYPKHKGKAQAKKETVDGKQVIQDIITVEEQGAGGVLSKMTASTVRP